MLNELNKNRLHLDDTAHSPLASQFYFGTRRKRRERESGDVRESPADAGLHARAERHQVRRDANVRLAHLLVLDEPVRVELVRVRAPNLRQPCNGKALASLHRTRSRQCTHLLYAQIEQRMFVPLGTGTSVTASPSLVVIGFASGKMSSRPAWRARR